MKNLVIWKSLVTCLNDHPFAVEIPEGAEILSAGAQNNELIVWFRCDPSKPKIVQKLIVVGTGIMGECPDATTSRFIGTVMLFDGTLVLHVFTPRC